MNIREGLAYDDVLLVPQYSEISTRSQVDVSIKMGKLQFEHPVVPANMSSISGFEMVVKVAQSGGLGILHRFMLPGDQLEMATKICDAGLSDHIGVSLGVKDDDWQRAGIFHVLGIRIFCIDIAHGNSKHCIDMIKRLKQLPEVTIIAGNVATGDGARRLWDAGADIVKIGVGPGSLCSTRVETGNGVPQLTALMDVCDTQKKLLARDRAIRPPEEQRQYPFIADGGLKSAGDVVKALVFADMVMMGNCFAGCEEAPGETIKLDGRCYKKYVGSSTHKTNHVEGIAALVPCTENFHTVLTKLLEGVRSGMSYQGVDNLTDLKESPEFIRITAAGLKESHPHDVVIR